jgi:hypothetical protein
MWEKASRYGGGAVNILNKQSLTANKGWSSSLGVEGRLAIHPRKKLACYELLHRPTDLEGLLVTTWIMKNECKICNRKLI